MMNSSCSRSCGGRCARSGLPRPPRVWRETSLTSSACEFTQAESCESVTSDTVLSVRDRICKLQREKQSIKAKLHSRGDSHRKLSERLEEILKELQDLSGQEMKIIMKLRRAA